MSKKEVTKLNGDLKRLENIQKVLLTAHAGKVPDNYVTILVEEFKFLWKACESNQKCASKTQKDRGPMKTLREQSNTFIPKDMPDGDSKGWKATPKDIPKVKLDTKPEGWDG